MDNGRRWSDASDLSDELYEVQTNSTGEFRHRVRAIRIPPTLEDPGEFRQAGEWRPGEPPRSVAD